MGDHDDAVAKLSRAEEAAVARVALPELDTVDRLVEAMLEPDSATCERADEAAGLPADD